MGTVAKIALGVVLGGTLLIGGCAVACVLLMSLGQVKQAEDAQTCADIIEVSGTSAFDRGQFAHVQGIVANRSGRQAARYVEVSVELLTGDGSVIASGWTNETNIEPGERRPFEKMIRKDGLRSWSKYRVGLRQCKLG